MIKTLTTAICLVFLASATSCNSNSSTKETDSKQLAQLVREGEDKTKVTYNFKWEHDKITDIIRVQNSDTINISYKWDQDFITETVSTNHQPTTNYIKFKDGRVNEYVANDSIRVKFTYNEKGQFISTRTTIHDIEKDILSAEWENDSIVHITTDGQTSTYVLGDQLIKYPGFHVIPISKYVDSQLLHYYPQFIGFPANRLTTREISTTTNDPDSRNSYLQYAKDADGYITNIDTDFGFTFHLIWK